MKRTIVIPALCAAAILAAALLVQDAASQPRIATTRQLQIIGASASNQTHGAWFVDLQANNVIFCERGASGVQCHATPIP